MEYTKVLKENASGKTVVSFSILTNSSNELVIKE